MSPDESDPLRDDLRAAHWPSLLPALAALTGDPGRFAHLWPERLNMLDPQGGMTAEARAAAAELAHEVIGAHRAGQLTPPPVDDELARELLAPLLGPDLAAYTELACEELCLRTPDPRAPSWRHAELAPDVPLTVAVIGAGMSGLLAAARLAQAGVEVTVLEKNPEVGGTWFENDYPGCRVDVPSHLYTYSQAPDLDWSHGFAAQPEILAGFHRFARESGVLRRIRFGTEVTALDWDSSRRGWHLTLRTGADASVAEEHLDVTVVVNAVGQLNRPMIPDIPGRERFAGPAFHSAAWDHQAPLDGARVAVIGTGASAVQLINPLARRAASTTIYQRTPAWLIRTPDFTEPVDPRLRRLFATVPGYQRWYRFWLLRQVSDALLPYATVDPDWDDGGHSVSAPNARMRRALERYLREQFADRPDLLEQVLPDYPPFAKRAIRDDGSWASTLGKPNVELVGERIAEITGSGVRTVDGRDRDADVIVWGTGFQPSRFLHPMRVRGRDGLDLHEHWAGEPGALLGMTVPGFPNMFMLYGPNTNIVVNGSAVYFSECQTTHLLGCLRLLLERGGTPVECSPAAYRAFRDRMDEANAHRAWGGGHVRNWYQSASGRVSQNWPLTVLEYWRLTRTVDPTDYPPR